MSTRVFFVSRIGSDEVLAVTDDKDLAYDYAGNYDDAFVSRGLAAADYWFWPGTPPGMGRCRHCVELYVPRGAPDYPGYCPRCNEEGVRGESLSETYSLAVGGPN